jgi:uncharacterized protein YndB with AHSA1/START domain
MMSYPSARHSTIAMARTYDAPVSEVFAAFVDPEDRGRIFSGTDELTVSYEQADLRVGGVDFFRLGRGDDLRFRGQAIYHDVVPERRIVYTDVVSLGESPAWIAAATLEFTPLDQRTQVKLTVQAIGLDGAEALESVSGRYGGLLDNLERHLRGTLGFKPRTVASD